ncbi:MAG: enoyl-CoA hydratase-related protein [Chloroflexota bacterium]
MTETIEFSIEGRVAYLTLNRPHVRNAFNAMMIEEVSAACRELSTREDVTVLVLRGAGPTFSAGADAHWMHSSLALSREDNLADALRMSDMFAALNTLPQAVVAGVQGAALGGGMGLLAACDIVVATEDAIFGFTEAKLGIIPAVISRVVLAKIGPGWARSLYLSAEKFGSTPARAMGLVHWIVQEHKLDAAVDKRVRELCSSGPIAVRAAKRLIADLADLDDSGIRQITAERIANLRVSPEGQEGLRAFLDKRRPSWRDV